MALGLVLVLAGVWILTGHRLWSPRFSRRRDARSLTGSPWSMAGFGASYAVASLGCTIAPFLAVVVTAFRTGTVVEGVALFLAYAVGMGLTVGAAAVAVALGRQGLVRSLRRSGRFLPWVSGSLLIVAGGYVAWYGAWELRVLHGGAGADPVVGAVAGLQQWLASHIDSVGAGGFLAVLAVLLGLGLITRRRSPRASLQAEAPPGSAEIENREPDEERA